MVGISGCLLFAVPFALAAVIPGPAQAALVARVLSRGPGEAGPFAVGMVAGNALWLCFAAFGLAVLAARFAMAFVLVKWLGVAYLAFLAWKLWRASEQPFAGHAPAPAGRTLGRFLGGVALTLGNPKAVVFFGAVLPQAFDLADLNVASFLQILLLGIAIDATVQASYLALAGRARIFFASPKRLRIVIRSSAGIIGGSAVFIAARG